ncbi:MAG: hypothetical protein M1818_006803 [Claussenomyces sp. TS43310]|nr:MAG: hypothetical protein M1818_006803 [Claussenomyces sp. TS43310]
MSCSLAIQDPFNVAILPRPIDQSAGKYVVSDVHGGTPGSRKRKRTEIAVGIDGEGLNIYDTKSSKLITSYALPPQSYFTCAPCSLKIRKTDRKTSSVERRTYVSTIDNTSMITVFKDKSSTDSEPQPVAVTHTYAPSESANPAVFLGITSSSVPSTRDDLVAVYRDGEIQCFAGDNLKLLWTSPPNALGRGTMAYEMANSKIVFSQMTNVDSARKGLFKARQDVFASFPKGVESDDDSSRILVAVSQPTDTASAHLRNLHVVLLPQNVGTEAGATTRSVQTLLSMQLPWLHKNHADVLQDISYDIHVSSGVFYELGDGVLSTFDVTGSTPKLLSQLVVDNMKSFLRLSSTSVMTASSQSVDVYNPAFKSLQASIQVGSHATDPSRKRKFDHEETISPESKLVSYSSKLNLAHAIKGRDLIAFQIEMRNDSSRSRPMGLLIDSLGRGIRRHDLAHEKFKLYFREVQDLDAFAAAQDIEAFEGLMSRLFHIRRDETELQAWKDTHPNGHANSYKAAQKESAFDVKPIPTWLWSEGPMALSREVDPFWIRYALSKIFRWTDIQKLGPVDDPVQRDDYRLGIIFFPFNVVKWLVDTGNLNKANIDSALREDLLLSRSQSIPAGQIIQALIDMDPTMEGLFSLLVNTYLEVPELVHAIRVLMNSLELFGDRSQPKHALLPNGDVDMVNGDVEAEIAEETEAANEDLQLAEFYLSDESNIRVQALSIALAKLHSLPSSSVVQGLRGNFKSSEMISLIHLLRFELARGLWTSRYFNASQEEDDSTMQNCNIVLVTDLLSCCIDAIGSGGWLSGDAMLGQSDQFESEEVISSLKLEVSAALEGIEEATYLRGLLAEMVRYGEAVQSAMPKEKEKENECKGKAWDIPGEIVKMRRDRPVVLGHGNDTATLPLGLKAEQRISLIKVGAGGELERRSARDIGRLKSRKVGKYTLERIAF